MLTVHGSIMLITAQHGLPPGRLTNRWEASLWLKGRQLYLGGFNSEEDAARAYDIVALSCKGLHVATNFPSAAYTAELAQLAGSTQVWLQPFVLPYVIRSAMPAVRGDATVATRHLRIENCCRSHSNNKVSILNVLTGCVQEEIVAYVRRKSSAFTRGKSRFRGVSGHNGRWEARIGAFGGRKNARSDLQLRPNSQHRPESLSCLGCRT